jgi:hypothetical protein
MSGSGYVPKCYRNQGASAGAAVPDWRVKTAQQLGAAAGQALGQAAGQELHDMLFGNPAQAAQDAAAAQARAAAQAEAQRLARERELEREREFEENKKKLLGEMGGGSGKLAFKDDSDDDAGSSRDRCRSVIASCADELAAADDALTEERQQAADFDRAIIKGHLNYGLELEKSAAPEEEPTTVKEPSPAEIDLDDPRPDARYDGTFDGAARLISAETYDYSGRYPHRYRLLEPEDQSRWYDRFKPDPEKVGEKLKDGYDDGPQYIEEYKKYRKSLEDCRQTNRAPDPDAFDSCIEGAAKAYQKIIDKALDKIKGKFAEQAARVDAAEKALGKYSEEALRKNEDLMDRGSRCLGACQ